MTTKDESLAIPGLEGMITTERPQGVDEGRTGAEYIQREDILTPRLALAQKTSPEIDPTSPRYMDGLKFTDLFNSISGANYKAGPLHFIVLRGDKPRWVEFNPLDQGGGMKDPNVPANDPRTEFGAVDPKTGRAVPPIATKFYDFIVLVLNGLQMEDPMANVMGLSLKSTGIKVARRLNLLIMQRGQKLIYKGVYELSSASEQNAQGSFAVYKVKNAGWLTPGSRIEQLAAEMYDAWKDRKAKIDMGSEHAAGGDVDFDPEKLERQSADM